ncbi:hypothetical protein V493_00541 [Pseudogymnoascus sp. VKM F-4281 (FW-2241)]|nr:hypothetical protein V493_00541 [Pseudogymnoascus sp. VKM F-4281 (FW-2241)]
MSDSFRNRIEQERVEYARNQAERERSEREAFEKARQDHLEREALEEAEQERKALEAFEKAKEERLERKALKQAKEEREALEASKQAEREREALETFQQAENGPSVRKPRRSKLRRNGPSENEDQEDEEQEDFDRMDIVDDRPARHHRSANNLPAEPDNSPAESDTLYNTSGHTTTSQLFLGRPGDIFIYLREITTIKLNSIDEYPLELYDDLLSEGPGRETKFLVVGVVGDSPRLFKPEPGQENVPGDVERFIAIIPTLGLSPLKTYALIDVGAEGEGFVPGIRDIGADAVFYRRQYSEGCTEPTTTRGQRKMAWKRAILRAATGGCGLVAGAPAGALAATAATKFDAAKLIRDIGACIGGLALVMPDNNAPGLDELIARLRIEWPGLDDPRLPAGSIEQFFNLSEHPDDAVLTEFDPVALAEVSQTLGSVVVSAEDFLIASRSATAIKNFWQVTLPVAQLVLVRQGMRLEGRTIRLGLAQIFFKALEGRLKTFGGTVYLSNLLDEMELHSSSSPKAAPTTATASTTAPITMLAMKLLLTSVYSSLKALVDDDMAEGMALEGAIGGIIPTGSFQQVWEEYGAAPDLNAAHMAMAEIAQLIQYEGSKRSRTRTAAATVVLENLRRILNAIPDE